MGSPTPSEDAKATLLLTLRFGSPSQNVKILTPAKFRLLNKILGNKNIQIGHFLGKNPEPIFKILRTIGMETRDFSMLLDSVRELDAALISWSQKGIWVVGETDDKFPKRILSKLKSGGFPLLFGAGNIDLLNSGGVLVAGTRDSSRPALKFATKLSERCAEENISVISSDMRGLDREAMRAAIMAKGNVICVLSDSLTKAISAKRHKLPLESGKLALVTPFLPETNFRVANAIRVNRYQYCLADFAVVVETRKSGGIWLGAEENRKARWTPTFVRVDGDIPSGNVALQSLGLLPLTQSDMTNCDNIGEYLIGRLTGFEAETNDKKHFEPSEARDRHILFDFFCTQMETFALVPRTSEDIRMRFDLSSEQAAIWIARALEKEILVKRNNAFLHRSHQQRS